jgi:glucose dehydrogenase
MLANPDPADWLMFNRTYDEQRFSPLDQINRANVAGLRMVWTRGLGAGNQEGTPLVHDGVIYVPNAGDYIFAADARTGDVL